MRPLTHPERGPCLMVAASNSAPAIKARADFVCDGTADEVEINLAIAMLTGGPGAYGQTTGGRIQLSEGTFSIAAPIAVSNGIRLEGVTSGLTQVVLAANANCNLIEMGTGGNSLSIIERMCINGNERNQTPAYNYLWNNAAGNVVCKVYDAGDDAWDDLSTSATLTGWSSNYQLLPDAASEAEGDAFAVGHATLKFWQLEFDDFTTGNGQPATWSADGATWTYWNGSTWAALTVRDHTGFLRGDGTRPLCTPGIIEWDAPSDWAKTTLDGVEGYYVKCAIASATLTQTPIIDDTNKDEPFIARPLYGIWHPSTAGAVDLRVKDVWFEDIPGPGIRFGRYYNEQVIGCTFEHLHGAAIEIDGTDGSVTMVNIAQNMFMSNSTEDGAGNALADSRQKAGFIRCYGSTGPDSGSVNKCMVTGNVLRHLRTHAIVIAGSAWTITGNQFSFGLTTQDLNDGIRVNTHEHQDQAASNITITGNTFSLEASSARPFALLHLRNLNSAGTGKLLKGVTFSGNVGIGGTWNRIVYEQIDAAAAAGSYSISGNVFDTDQAVTMIEMNRADNVSLVGNTLLCSAGGGYGVKVGAGNSYWTIIGNTFTVGQGIDLSTVNQGDTSPVAYPTIIGNYGAGVTEYKHLDLSEAKLSTGAALPVAAPGSAGQFYMALGGWGSGTQALKTDPTAGAGAFTSTVAIVAELPQTWKMKGSSINLNVRWKWNKTAGANPSVKTLDVEANLTDYSTGGRYKDLNVTPATSQQAGQNAYQTTAFVLTNDDYMIANTGRSNNIHFNIQAAVTRDNAPDDAWIEIAAMWLTYKEDATSQ